MPNTFSVAENSTGLQTHRYKRKSGPPQKAGPTKAFDGRSQAEVYATEPKVRR
jgi:hypothetical protein